LRSNNLEDPIMLRSACRACIALLLLTSLAPADEKSQSLFNGRDLSGWEGDPEIWSVEDGAIVGRLTAEKPLDHNTFLVWKGGEVGDFRLRFEYRIEGGNSGVQYRSRLIDPAKWIVGGYQADIDSANKYTGILYDERGTRAIMANRGERVTFGPDGKRETEKFADAAELQKSIREKQWNKYVVVARGARLRHKINGKLMSETVDQENEKRADTGILALQVHQGPPMVVQFRKIRLKRLADSEDGHKKERKGTKN
jgi:hypothetical protein